MEETQRINRFLHLKAEYERALCRDQSALSFEALDAVERELGYSFWSIEARIGALQLHEGLEAQKAYLSQIIDVLPDANPIPFVAYHVSRRMEPSTAPLRFAAAFAEKMGEWEESDGLGPYLNFRVAGISPTSADACANVLRHETASSIVDQYETFVSLAKTAAIIGDADLTLVFDPAVEKIAVSISDERLAKTMLVRGNVSGLAHLTFITDEASESLLVGDIDAASQAIRRCSAERPNDPVLWLLRARIAEMTGEVIPTVTSLVESAPRNLETLMGESTEDDQALITLLRLSIGFHSLSFAPSLLLYAWQTLPHRAPKGGQLEQFAFIERSGARPDEVSLLPKAIHGPYLDAVAASVASTPSQTRAAVVVSRPLDGLPEICTREMFRAQVEALLLQGDNQGALEKLLPQVDAEDAESSRWAIREAANTMVTLREHTELARFIVTRAIHRPGLIRSLPITECIAGITDETRSVLQSELTLPIILHLAVQQDEGLADARAYAYEDFLIANGLERPSQLYSVACNFDHTLLSYYLRHLCVPEIMQVSSEFQSTRELQEERITVLRLLIELDGERAKVYEDELREVTRSLLIYSGMRHVGQTKIFVDLPALRRWAERNLKEDFMRLQSHLRAGLGINRDEINALLQRLAQGKAVPPNVLELPKNEATDLLVKMTVSLNREFLMNPDHGLDCYLSMRIRHGTLAGQLRTPLEVEHLITQRRASSDEYTTNERWTAALQEQCVDPAALDQRLAKFSRDYDDMVAEISNELIQIRTPERPQGLFDVGVFSGQLLVLSTSLAPDVTFDEFVDKCFDMYWDGVDICLEKVRHICNERLKPRITRLFNSLETEAAPLAGAIRPDLERAIRSASTGANQALDIVADWFRLPAPIEAQIFPIEAMIDVGLKCVTTIYPEFHPDLRQTVTPGLPPFGDALAFFSDVFFIVFDNVRRHSGLTNPAVDLSVEEGVGEDGGSSCLLIIVRSEVAQNVDIQGIEEKLARIRQRIATDDYRAAVISEGGTGLIKLHRILERRNRETNMLSFGFIDGRFLVKFGVFWMETSI